MVRVVMLLLAFAFACGPEDTTFVLDTRIVTADGANPLEGRGYDHLRIVWAQSGYDTVVQEIDLTGDSFEVGFDLDTLASSQVRVELTGPSGTIHGAPPTFSPADSGGFLRVVVGEPGTCARISRLEAPEPARADSAYLRWQGYLIQFGGLADSGRASAVTFSDLYWAEAAAPLPDLLEPVGATKAAFFGSTMALILSEEGVWAYEIDPRKVEGDERSTTKLLYDSAGIASAVVRNGEGVVLVAGGGDASSPDAAMARVATNGRTVVTSMAGARAFAGAAPAGTSDVVVAGGTRAPGAPFVEWVDMSTLATTIVDDPAAEAVRNEPLVLEGESSHWIVGGMDAAGDPITTSWVLSGCPEACALEPGPEVDVRTAPRADGLTLTDGLSVFTAVEAGGWHLEPVADLARERNAAGIVVYESGMVFLHGGRDPDGPHLDGELCFPAELTPLD